MHFLRLLHPRGFGWRDRFDHPSRRNFRAKLSRSNKRCLLSTVEAAKPSARPARPARRAARAPTTTRRIAAQRQDAVPEAARDGGAGIERANGPVNGMVANGRAQQEPRRTRRSSKRRNPSRSCPDSRSSYRARRSIGEAIRYTSGTQGQLYGAAPVFDTEVRVRGFIAPRYLDGLRLPYDIDDPVRSTAN